MAPTRRQLLSAGASAAAASLVGGCVPKPLLQLHSARVSGVGTGGVSMDMWVRVGNTASFDVRVRGVRANLTLAERYAMPPIRYASDNWLAANRWTLVKIPVTVPWNVLPQLLAETAGRAWVPYHIRGVADVTAVRMLGVEVDGYDLNEIGNVSREELVRAASRSVGF